MRRRGRVHMKRKNRNRCLSILLSVSMVVSFSFGMHQFQKITDAAEEEEERINALGNGSFESVAFPDENMHYRYSAADYEAAGGLWKTTGTDIELFQKNNVFLMEKTLYPAAGKYAAEANGSTEGTLYQYVNVPEGSENEWGFCHRGRNGQDVVAVILGPKQTTDPAKDAQRKDPFMYMTDWLKGQAVSIPTEPGCSQMYTVYAKPFSESGTLDGSSFSLDESETCNQRWSVWFAVSGNGNWNAYGTDTENAYIARRQVSAMEPDYTYSYTAPEGSPEQMQSTLFAFCGVEVESGELTEGNLLDDVQFTSYVHIKAEAEEGGEGTLTLGTQNYETTATSKISKKIVPGQSLTICGKPEPDYVFVGARVQMGTEEFVIDAEQFSVEGEQYTYAFPDKINCNVKITFLFEVIATPTPEPTEEPEEPEEPEDPDEEMEEEEEDDYEDDGEGEDDSETEDDEEDEMDDIIDEELPDNLPENIITPAPTRAPTPEPIITVAPTAKPTKQPTPEPVKTAAPTTEPTAVPTVAPTKVPATPKPTPVVSTQAAVFKMGTVHAGKDKIVLNWKRVENADGYIVYGNRCNSHGVKYKLKKQLAVLGAGKTAYVSRELEENTSYKFQIFAYKIVDGKKTILLSSLPMHIRTESKDSTKGNVLGVTVDKKEFFLKKGQKKKVKVELKFPKEKNVEHHVDAIRYWNANPSVAGISSDGRITARKVGSCDIYAFSANGKWKKFTVYVKK